VSNDQIEKGQPAKGGPLPTHQVEVGPDGRRQLVRRRFTAF
jgi:hypothetical protein